MPDRSSGSLMVTGALRQVDDAVLAVLRDEHLLAVGGDLVAADGAQGRLLLRGQVVHLQSRLRRPCCRWRM